MSLAVPTRSSQSSKLAPKTGAGWTVVAALGVALVAAASTLAHDRLFHRPGVEDAVKKAGPSRPVVDLATTVVMPEGKFQTAGIVVEPVLEVEMPREVPVTGRIEADPNRRAEVRPRASGVVRSVPAQPGTKVKAGDVLVVLDSPDVGSARLKVRERQRELATVRVEAGLEGRDRRQRRGHDQAAPRRGLGQELAQAVRQQVAGELARGTLISAWAELELASHEYDKMSDLNKKKIVGEHNRLPRRAHQGGGAGQIRLGRARAGPLRRLAAGPGRQADGPQRRGDGRRRRPAAPGPGRGRGHQ